MERERPQKLVSTEVLTFDFNFKLRDIYQKLNQNPETQYLLFYEDHIKSSFLLPTVDFLKRSKPYPLNEPGAWPFLERFSPLYEPARFIDLYEPIPPDFTRGVITFNNKIVGVFDMQEYDQELTGRILSDVLPEQSIHELLKIGRNSIRTVINYQWNEDFTLESRREIPGSRLDSPIQDAKQKEGPSDLYHLNVDCPKSVQEGESFKVLASIDREAFGDGESAPVVLQDDSLVEIVISTRKGLQCNSPRNLSVKIPQEVGKKRGFQLQATGQGPAQFIVYLMADNVELVHLEINVEITSQAPPVSDPQHETAPVSILYSLSQPDLNLFITESRPQNNQVELTFLVNARVATDRNLSCYYRTYGPVTLMKEPEGYFRDFYRGIEQIPLNNIAQGVIAEQEMMARGNALFEALIPADLRQYLWQIKDQISTVMISSEEPWIPWELCWLSMNVNGTVQTDQFLCERFAISRWIPGNAPSNQLVISKVALIIPGDSGLDFAQKETEKLTALFQEYGMSVDVITASFIEVIRALSLGVYSVIHFAGHGSSSTTSDPNDSMILLNDNQKLTPKHIFGNVAALGKASPLIFFNACQVQQPSMSLTGLGGWAAKFAAAGAAAFIGTNWSVYDDSASDFSIAFYTKLLGGATVAESIKAARLSIKNKQGDPTWLSYTAFAGIDICLKKVKESV